MVNISILQFGPQVKFFDHAPEQKKKKEEDAEEERRKRSDILFELACVLKLVGHG